MIDDSNLMNSAARTGYECFDELTRQLRAEGHVEAADRLHALLHGVAWTTGAELTGELGLAILAFERSAPAAGAVLRQRLKACMGVVKRVWPDMR